MIRVLLVEMDLLSEMSQSRAPEPELMRTDVGEVGARLDPPAEAEAPGVWPARGQTPVTVLVPTKNEAVNIVECLRRLRWAEQVALVDSGSDDATWSLAQAMGAEVYWFDYANHSPEGWPKKRNWALRSLPLRHEWVLFMDADEHMTPELAAEVHAVVTGGGDGGLDGYWINRRLWFLGRWIKHCGYYPSWNLRLFRHALGEFEQMTRQGDTGSGDMEVHEHVKIRGGRVGRLRHDFLHYAYASISSWVEKHNRYSSWEAHVKQAGIDDGIDPRLWGSGLQRKRWLRERFARLPLRPTLRFAYHYWLRRGFLDGRAGLTLCRLMAVYETMNLAKTLELQRPPRAAENAGPSASGGAGG